MDWTIIQQALPAYGHGFVLTVWLSLVGIIGSIIVGVIASLLQYFKTPMQQLMSNWHAIHRF